MKNIDDDNGNFFSLFTGLDKLIHVVADMAENNKDEVLLKGDIKSNQNKNIGKYGINVKLGTDKLDHFHEFQFSDKQKKDENKMKTITPVTDLFDEEDNVTIVVELPGVEKDDIELNLDKNIITITASKKDTLFSKQITLGFIPEYSKVKENFQNSIYSVMISKNTLT
ncbi:MAG: hypothetical protein K0S47_3635 [Herbinix sp.]|jgi:HSP20 family protein|nr:hypothetical protein [Herbinix sp.]